ncbi:hypothetical protein LX36DRAFT_438646 [Colletotrichum falcatum]|nr:hypothetical protein LX36DRAFT_438646 [Colletotrichum falcatum]
MCVRVFFPVPTSGPSIRQGTSALPREWSQESSKKSTCGQGNGHVKIHLASPAIYTIRMPRRAGPRQHCHRDPTSTPVCLSGPVSCSLGFRAKNNTTTATAGHFNAPVNPWPFSGPVVDSTNPRQPALPYSICPVSNSTGNSTPPRRNTA